MLVFALTAQAQYTLTIDDVVFENGEIKDYLNTTEKDIVIPDNFNGATVTSIGNQAFYSNNLTSVTIPNSVTSIGDYAFTYNKLTSITIPNSVTYIGAAAFQQTQLTSVTLSNSVTYIGNSAFYQTQIASVTIPNSVTYIGNYAFYETQLTSITVPNSVTYIGAFAFFTDQLTSFTLPKAVKEGYEFENWKSSKSDDAIPAGTEVTDLGASYTAVFHEVVTNINDATAIKLKINVYPNPTTDKVSISNENSENLYVKVVSLSGRIFKEKTSSANIIDVDLSDCPRETLLLDINNGKERVVKKVIKK